MKPGERDPHRIAHEAGGEVRGNARTLGRRRVGFTGFALAFLCAPAACASNLPTPAAPDAGPSVDGALPDAVASADAASDAAVPLCNSTTGRSIPIPVCSPVSPCDKPLPLLPQTPITEPSFVPVCATSRASHPVFDDGAPLAFQPAGGVARYTCRFRHPDASVAMKRPLIVWIPGSGGSAQDIYDLTLLRAKALTYDVSRDPARPGYHLLSVQARNLHWMTPNHQDGPKHDFFHRDLRSPSTNSDVANLDRLVDEAVQEETVDPQRIYVMGWSNGAQFAQLYAIARFSTATPGGNRVAAAAVYSGGDPFHDQPDRPAPPCQLDPYPKSTVPILVASRACDVYACDAQQATALLAEGVDVNPGAVVTTWMTDLAVKVGDPNGHWLLLSGIGTVAPACTPAAQCTGAIALGNHARWPDGTTTADGGRDHETDMLDFLGLNPHP